jgi:hypothetical protein
LQAADNKWKEIYPLDNAFSEKELILDISAGKLAQLAIQKPVQE